jgi:molecular chaperone GrpE
MMNRENDKYVPGIDTDVVIENTVGDQGVGDTPEAAASAAAPSDATSATVSNAADACASDEADANKLAEEVAYWKDYARRAQAEFENTRKRLIQSHLDEVKRAGIRVVGSIIPVIDDIEYAIAHATETDNEIKDGLVAIHRKLMSALELEGVEIFDPAGEPFDSETAQAVTMIDGSGLPEQTVVDVVQKGYRLGGKTLRPAMVTVSTGA